MNAKDMDFSDILTKELEEKVKSAAEVSMGCEISDMDLESMRGLCQQVSVWIEASDSGELNSLCLASLNKDEVVQAIEVKRLIK